MQTALSSELEPPVQDYFSEAECNKVIRITKKLEDQYTAFKELGDDEKSKVAKQILSLRQQTNTSCISRMFSCWFEAPSEIKQKKLNAIINSLSNLQIDGYEYHIDYKIIGMFSAQRTTKTRQTIDIIEQALNYQK